MSINDKCQ